MAELRRCQWPTDAPFYLDYHDTEWGVPVHDDQQLFAKLILDGFQAGLSWYIILKKRDAFYKAFDDFDPVRIARYRQRKLDALANNPDIVRNKAKIVATVGNAKAYLAMAKAGEPFGEFIWSFTGGETIQNRRRSWKSTPATSKESIAMAKELKRRGFKFCGPTICYAFMQAVGMVNDHLVSCYRHKELGGS